MLIEGDVKAVLGDLPFGQPHIGFAGSSARRDVLRIDLLHFFSHEWFVGEDETLAAWGGHGTRIGTPARRHELERLIAEGRISKDVLEAASRSPQPNAPVSRRI